MTRRDLDRIFNDAWERYYEELVADGINECDAGRVATIHAETYVELVRAGLVSP